VTTLSAEHDELALSEWAAEGDKGWSDEAWRAKGERSMADIVKLPKRSKGQTSGEQPLIDATRVVAKLSLLGRLEYERVRCKAAKELGCRVSFLDGVLENIHQEISTFKHDHRLRSFAREEGERFISMREPDSL
jgi:hypothetical protein